MPRGNSRTNVDRIRGACPDVDDALLGLEADFAGCRDLVDPCHAFGAEIDIALRDDIERAGDVEVDVVFGKDADLHDCVVTIVRLRSHQTAIGIPIIETEILGFC
ncbi:MAG: hypothetical protein AW11_01355 [Candidatus Accumulibacter regalis]|uniref:Uncharacterized protein n=1 Tax=Accumulibacter regalis TaxID=522306 RepID=A0A011QJW3_ACCRE|nr:MAG: hypothetical protein AW11_01355 [Candidatus Accumulibacter regalis]